MKKIIKKIIYLGIVASPFGSVALSFSLGSFQLTLFRGCILISVILAILYSNRKEENKKKNTENLQSLRFMLIWVVYSIITILWAKNIGEYIKYEFFIVTGVIVVFIFNSFFESETDIITAFKAFSVSSCIQCVFGGIEVLLGKYFFVPESRLIFINNHEVVNIPVGMLYNPNDFATFMYFGCYVNLMLFSIEKKTIQRYFYFILTILCSILLICTKSTSCVAGAIIAMAILLFYASKTKAAAIAIISIPLLFSPPVYNFISQHISFSGDAISNKARFNLIKEGFRFLLDTVGFGVGTGQQSYWLYNYSVTNVGGLEQFHNWWLEILFVYGVFIFIMYIRFYTQMIRCFYNRNKYKKNVISKYLVAIMSGCLFTCLASSSNFRTEYFWTFWAICIAYQGIEASSSLNENENRVDAFCK